MTPNHLKLGCAITFIIFFASVVCLILLAKTLIWNKITLLASNLLNLCDLVENEPLKSIYKKNFRFSFLYSIITAQSKDSRSYN